MSQTVQQLPCDQDPEHIPDRMTRRVLIDHAGCGPRCRVWLAAAAAASVDLED
ncbi:hypothetical protein ACTD5D_31825 [Nocardia takedensis]|uniref:hypothetical protein n=1 Tax=Nocardia takedensis TaxID=259390 RepID=UPI003F7770C3